MNDPALGRIVADRYEIVSAIKEGGMGRVYVAVQRSLKRKVALKLIRPSMASVDSVADRFLVEAQAASQLNHPNVVSIYDFGQSGEGQQTELFLVMELLSGSDLREHLDAKVPIPQVRIVDILRQTLAGLAEAHDHGISHRDVKPDNIYLEPTRRGTERVKLIDFGLARVERDASLTIVGQFVGTPWYSAPEQVHGEHGPLSDLYSVGVVLFEMLTGDVPFDDPSPVQILAMHRTAPRPDPSKYARGREVSRALADVCMRAMSIEPAERYPNAEALADALLAAHESRSATRRETSLFPHRVPSAAPTPASLEPPEFATPRLSGFGLLESLVPPAPILPPSDAVRLIGRADDLGWIREAITSSAPAIVLHGRPGVGRSRLLREAAAMVNHEGGKSLLVSSRMFPHDQIGYLGLGDLIVTLTELPADDLATGWTAEGPAAAGLRAIFHEGQTEGVADRSVRGNASAALVWASQRAVEIAQRRRVVLCLDDADRLDGVSLLALGDAAQAMSAIGLRILMTSLTPPDHGQLPSVVAREVRGLDPGDVATWLSAASALAVEARPFRVARRDRVEPLYLEHAWAYIDDDAQTPPTLEEMIAARVEGLFPAERRVLQALAVIGDSTVDGIAGLLSEDVTDAIRLLVEGHFVEMVGDVASVSHRIIAEQAMALAPSGTIAALHANAFDLLPVDAGVVELRAVHSLRGRADFEAFLLVEEATRLRTLRGDDDGAVRLLGTGLDAAMTQARRGDAAQQNAETVFARKLGAALVHTGRAAEAIQILERNVARNRGTADAARALEQLAIAHAVAGRLDLAERWKREAFKRATELGDRETVARLAQPTRLPPKWNPPKLRWMR